MPLTRIAPRREALDRQGDSSISSIGSVIYLKLYAAGSSLSTSVVDSPRDDAQPTVRTAAGRSRCEAADLVVLDGEEVADGGAAAVHEQVDLGFLMPRVKPAGARVDEGRLTIAGTFGRGRIGLPGGG